MEQVTIERAGAREGTPRFLTWRDAVTPFTRASRRRWVAIGVLLLAAIGVTMLWGVDLGYRTSDDFSPSFTSLLLVAILLGVVRQSTGGVAAVDHPELDERDLAARNAAFRVAYPLLILIVGVSFVVVALTLPEVTIRKDGFLIGDAQRFSDGTLYGLLLWAGLWAAFLPMAVLAWREPDALSSEAIDPAEGAGASEPVRDAIVLVTFAAALALSLVAGEGGWAMVALVVGLSALAGWKRREVGQRPVANVLGNVGAVMAAFGIVGLVAPLLFDSVDTSSVWATAAVTVAGLVLLTLSRSGRPTR